MAKFPRTAFSDWLLGNDFLEEALDESGNRCKIPTEKGRQIGLASERRTSQNGDYFVNVFSPATQNLIYDNLDEIVSAHYAKKARERAEKAENVPPNAGKPWTERDEAELRSAFASGLSTREIAARLQRNASGINARLRKLGLIE